MQDIKKSTPGGRPATLEELQRTKHEDLAVPQDDKTAAEVRAWLKQQNPSDTPADSAPEKPEINIPHNTEFENKTAAEQLLSEALIPTNTVTVTDEEKQAYLKSILLDEPVRMTISLFNDKMRYSLRSRTAYEQERVLSLLMYAEKTNDLPRDMLNYTIQRMHYYMAALMVEKINGALFSDLRLLPYDEAGQGTVDDRLQKDSDVLRAFVTEHFDKRLGVPQWTAMLNAMRIFEAKCELLAKEAVNENFWNPQG